MFGYVAMAFCAVGICLAIVAIPLRLYDIKNRTKKFNKVFDVCAPLAEIFFKLGTVIFFVAIVLKILF